MTGQKSPATFFVFLFDLKAEKNDVAAVGKGWMRSDVPPKTALLKCMRRQTWDIFLPASGVQFGKGGNRQPRKINHFSA